MTNLNVLRLLLGIILILTAVIAAIKGEGLFGKTGEIFRDKDPLLFWFAVTLWLFIGSLLTYAALAP